MDVNSTMKLKDISTWPCNTRFRGFTCGVNTLASLGSLGRCLVTITADSVVRLWEIDRENRWSFDRCSLSIDLKKLGNAHYAEQDLNASSFGYKAFSPDTAELEPGRGSLWRTRPDTRASLSAMTL